MPRFTDPKGQKRPATRSTRESVQRAEQTRRGVEGLTGIGAGRRSSSFTAKRVGRILLAFVLMALFVCGLYFAAWKSELIGGRTIPDVSGWISEKAVAELNSAGFPNVSTQDIQSAEVQEGMVIESNPASGNRVDPETQITLSVAVAPSAEEVTSQD